MTHPTDTPRPAVSDGALHMLGLLDGPVPDEPPHPRPHPGCFRCDPAFVASKRAHFAGIKRTRTEPNRWRFVAIDGGEVTLAFPPEEASR